MKRVSLVLFLALMAIMSYANDIVIDRTCLTLTYTDRHVTHVYPVVIGVKINTGETTCTPPGVFEITYKTVDPYYSPMPDGSPVIKPWKYDKRNKYGTRIMGLSYHRPGATRGLSIHGTNEPELIPGFRSSMCIRLKNEDVEVLYDLVRVGDKITII